MSSHRLRRVRSVEDALIKGDEDIVEWHHTRLLGGVNGRCELVELVDEGQKRVLRRLLQSQHQYYSSLTWHATHPNITKTYELLPDQDGSLLALQQFASHGSLRALLSYMPEHALSEDNARRLFQELVVACDYLIKEGCTNFAVSLDSCFLHRDDCFTARRPPRRPVYVPPTPAHNRAHSTLRGPGTVGPSHGLSAFQPPPPIASNSLAAAQNRDLTASAQHAAEQTAAQRRALLDALQGRYPAGWPDIPSNVEALLQVTQGRSLPYRPAPVHIPPPAAVRTPVNRDAMQGHLRATRQSAQGPGLPVDAAPAHPRTALGLVPHTQSTTNQPAVQPDDHAEVLLRAGLPPIYVPGPRSGARRRPRESPGPPGGLVQASGQFDTADEGLTHPDRRARRADDHQNSADDQRSPARVPTSAARMFTSWNEFVATVEQVGAAVQAMQATPAAHAVARQAGVHMPQGAVPQTPQVEERAETRPTQHPSDQQGTHMESVGTQTRQADDAMMPGYRLNALLSQQLQVPLQEYGQILDILQPSAEAYATAASVGQQDARQDSSSGLEASEGEDTEAMLLADSGLRLLLNPRPLFNGHEPASGTGDQTLLRNSIWYLPMELWHLSDTPRPSAAAIAPSSTHAAPDTADQEEITHSAPRQVYMLGTVLYNMLTGSSPYVRPSTLRQAYGLPLTQACHVLAQDIANAPLVIPDHVSAAAAGLLRQLLQKQPHRRISFNSILEHPWVKQDAPLGAEAFNSGLVTAAARRRSAAALD